MKKIDRNLVVKALTLRLRREPSAYEIDLEVIALTSTPKTLERAVINGLCTGAVHATPENVRVHVKDFLAQKFAGAILKAETPEEQDRLQSLWLQITLEEPKSQERSEQLRVG